MTAFNFNRVPKVTPVGFIDKDYILSLGSEEDIFALVFGFAPVEFELITSPFRGDRNPGCWFEYSFNGKLLFKDFADHRRPKNRDCFDAVADKFGFTNLYQTLKYLKNYFLNGDLVVPAIAPIATERRRTKPGELNLFFDTKPFSNRDKRMWMPYGISKAHLIEDKVFSISKYMMSRVGEESKRIRCTRSTYAITGFADHKIKIYDPYNTTGILRFVTNCKSADLGHVWTLNPSGRQLVITKSYKDWRVLKNLGLNTFWVQSENSIPPIMLLKKYCNSYDNVIVFYDNDDAGIRFALKMSEIINANCSTVARALWLPESLNSKSISDPADLRKFRGNLELVTFLKSKAVIL